jgi:hypothetical protein
MVMFDGLCGGEIRFSTIEDGFLARKDVCVWRGIH